MALVVLLAVLALAPRCTHADPISDRACSKPGLTAFPFCNVSLPRAARIADLVSRLAGRPCLPVVRLARVRNPCPGDNIETVTQTPRSLGC